MEKQPRQILISATLNTGEKKESENISVTVPKKTLSATFPSPPAATKEMKAFLNLLELGWNIILSENEDKTVIVNKEKSTL